jgi:hypothetical protein
MALLPPDSTPRRGRRDPAEEAAAARQRARFARDIGDEQGQAWAHEPRRRRGKFTIGTTAVLVLFGLGTVPLFFTGGGEGGLLDSNCDRPGIEVSAGKLTVGDKFSWQAAGPAAGPYVVTIDAATVTGPATGPVTPDAGRVLAGPTQLTGCRSTQTVTDGPDRTGVHEVALFRRAGSGWERAAVALLTVS